MTTDSERTATVRFTAPVEGFDPSDGDVFLATRHRINAVWARQDARETLFVNDAGEVVARWPTALIKNIEWQAAPEPDDRGTSPSVGTLEWRAEVQAAHPRAYQRWDADEEDRLSEEFGTGLTVEEIAARHQRRPGGIIARLVRLGLVSEEAAHSGIEASSVHEAEALLGERAPALVKEAGDRQGREPLGVAPASINELCRHDLAVATCAICKHDARPPVYITGGGVRYHRTPDCTALTEGQRQVDARGGDTEPIETVHRGSARLEGRGPCLTCRPDS